MYWLARWQSLQKLREGRRKGTRWAGHSLMAIVQFGEEFGCLGQTSMSPSDFAYPANRPCFESNFHVFNFALQ